LEFDVIALHTHPNDPLPNLAFYDQPGSIIFFNYGDHQFTVSMDVARVVADLRLTGQDLTFSRRASGPRKCLVPLPLIDDKPFHPDKAGARRKLGLPIDAPIALTLGEWFKYQPALGYNFPEALSSICKEDPRVIVVAIGISELEVPPILNRLPRERFRPVGFVHDPEILDLYYSAADIYLDCFPCGSGTSFLDAARHALPVQRLSNPYVPILQSDDLALDSVLSRASNQSEYVAGVLEWLRWPESKRTELGGRFRAAVLREHCGISWKKKWLNPALNALDFTGPSAAQLKNEVAEGEQDHYLGLALVCIDACPASMRVAATILEDPEIDWRIRISGLWHSIKPWLFDTAHDGMARERFVIFRNLVKTVLPKPIVIVVAKLLHPILKRLQDQGVEALHRADKSA
jgi:hypothetical protein